MATVNKIYMEISRKLVTVTLNKKKEERRGEERKKSDLSQMQLYHNHILKIEKKKNWQRKTNMDETFFSSSLCNNGEKLPSFFHFINQLLFSNCSLHAVIS